MKKQTSIKRKAKPRKSKHASLIAEIKRLVEGARQSIVQKINTELLITYWNVGKLIALKEQEENIDEKSSRQLILELSKELTFLVGKGFSRSNLFAMRRFYQLYKTVQTVSGHVPVEFVQTVSGQTSSMRKRKIKQASLTHLGKTISFQLGWSHYCELIKVDDDLERSFYFHQSIHENWSVRELQRQMETALFERIALSKSKKSVMKLAQRGQLVTTDDDLVRNPYILEFLNIPEKYHYSEKHFEQKIIDNLQNFILELGKGFTFVGRQFRITIDNTHYHIDLVFYHRILKCFVLFDLKVRDVKHHDIGQMNLYLNYFKAEQNAETDNPPIGIILARHKGEVMVEYATGGISNKIFVSKYQLYLPDKRILQRKMRELLPKNV
ncbi:MAG: YhcG family protein [Cyclobacteriaceae bacterium]|jgi:predicted nuclease of restriction endonuclease-like (RecB) superfamily|nr:PDDEXK nuclease domain-containing protein [Flammeovirgaceae bacterium]